MSKIVTINLNIDESIIPFFLGKYILNNYGYALVGISLGNSYFKEDILITFFEKIKNMFCHIYIFIPTLPYIHTLRAKNITSNPERKSKRDSIAMNNMVNKIIEKYKNFITLIKWDKDITKNEEYKSSLEYLKQLYKDNTHFKTTIRLTSEKVIEGKYKDISKEESIDHAKNFLLEEIAFLRKSDKILGISKPITYIYKEKWDIFEKYTQKEFDEGCDNIGFLVIEVSTTKEFISKFVNNIILNVMQKIIK